MSGRSPFYFLFGSNITSRGVAVSGLRRRSGEPTETLPGRKAETDRVCEGISEGFHLAKTRRVAPRGAEASGHATRSENESQVRSITARALRNTEWNIGRVSLPVNVFCWLGW